MSESISECIEYGGKREHTWYLVCREWISIAEDPIPRHQWPSGIMSCRPYGMIQVLTNGQVEWRRDRWHFGKYERCIWCAQIQMTDEFLDADTYYRADAARLAMQQTPPYKS